MQLFIDLFGFLSVILRGLILTAQSLTFGGVAFLLCLASPLAPSLAAAGDQITRRVLRLLYWSAVALAGVEALNIVSLSTMLMGAFQMSWTEALSAEAAVSDLLVLTPAVCIALATYRAHVISLNRQLLLGLFGVALLWGQISTTHSTSRLDTPATLIAAELLHMFGAAMWIGGIPYFIMSLLQTEDGFAWRQVGRRFSLMSICAVAMIAVGGTIMSIHYIGSIEAFYGTAYGVMVLAKIALFAVLLLLGGMNFLTVERLRRDPATPILRLRRFAEAEIGVGLTVLFAAALTHIIAAGDRSFAQPR